MLPPPRSEKAPRTIEVPERWKHGRRRAALLSLGVIALLASLMYLLGFTGGIRDLDMWWLRARFTLRERWYGTERDDRIIIVAIDDKCFDKWPELFVFWGPHFTDTINNLRRSGAKVIALDWIQRVEIDSQFNKDYDEKLGQAINQTPGIVLGKWMRPDKKYDYPIDQLRYSLPGAMENGDEGESSMGFVDAPSTTSFWSYIFPVIPGSNGRDVSFSARIVQKSGLADPFKVAVREDGTMVIRYRGGAGEPFGGTFERVSMYDVATAKAPNPRWKDKIVLIGDTSKGSNDSHYIPMFANAEPNPAMANANIFIRTLNGIRSKFGTLTETRVIPGVEAHAHAVATMLDNAAIEEPGPLEAWLLSGFCGAIGILIYVVWNWSRAVLFTIGAVLAWAILSLVLFCTSNLAIPTLGPLLFFLLGAAMLGGYRAFSEERERAQVMSVWGRHQDPRIIHELLAFPERRGGQGRELQVTVLFADLKNFTKTVEHLPPTRALEVLNRYLALLSEIISKHGGIVDKYLGDGLMAQWGAPLARPDHAEAAVAACLEIQDQLRTLSEQLRGTNEVVFETRLTLHSGPVVAGLVGSQSKEEYTLIGDTVNVTSRMQETAKQLDADFLISETTHAALEVPLHAGQQAEVAIRGRTRPLIVFEVLEGDISSADDRPPPQGGPEVGIGVRERIRIDPV